RVYANEIIKLMKTRRTNPLVSGDDDVTGTEGEKKQASGNRQAETNELLEQKPEHQCRVTMHSKFARVIIDRAIRRELDYAIPEPLSARVGIGARVRVPFRDRRALATVVALLEETNAKGIREIEAVIGEGPTLSEPLLELARWIASYYCCPIEAVMRSLLPQVIRRAEVG